MSLGIHLRALSLDDVKIPTNKTRLEIALLKWHPCLPGANELNLAKRHSMEVTDKKAIIALFKHAYFICTAIDINIYSEVCTPWRENDILVQ